jgi:hypothetical protein
VHPVAVIFVATFKSNKKENSSRYSSYLVADNEYFFLLALTSAAEPIDKSLVNLPCVSFKKLSIILNVLFHLVLFALSKNTPILLNSSDIGHNFLHFVKN